MNGYQIINDILKEDRSIYLQREIIKAQNQWQRTRNPYAGQKLAFLKKQLKAEKDKRSSDISDVRAIDPRAISSRQV